MISFFKTPSQSIIAVESNSTLAPDTLRKLNWLFGDAELIDSETIDKAFIGPRRELITPWSTCAVEITQNMGIEGISRIEEYTHNWMLHISILTRCCNENTHNSINQFLQLKEAQSPLLISMIFLPTTILKAWP